MKVVKTELEEDIDSVRRSTNVYISTVKAELERKHAEDIDYIWIELVPIGKSK